MVKYQKGYSTGQGSSLGSQVSGQGSRWVLKAVSQHAWVFCDGKRPTDCVLSASQNSRSAAWAGQLSASQLRLGSCPHRSGWAARSSKSALARPVPSTSNAWRCRPSVQPGTAACRGAGRNNSVGQAWAARVADQRSSQGRQRGARSRASEAKDSSTPKPTRSSASTRSVLATFRPAPCRGGGDGGGGVLDWEQRSSGSVAGAGITAPVRSHVGTSAAFERSVSAPNTCTEALAPRSPGP